MKNNIFKLELKKRPKTIRIGPGPIESFVDNLLDLVLGTGRGKERRVPVRIKPPHDGRSKGIKR